MKFKVGDRVRVVPGCVIDNFNGSFDLSNKTGTIEQLSILGNFGVKIDGLESKGGAAGLFWFNCRDCKLIKKKKEVSTKEVLESWAKVAGMIAFTPKFQIGDIVKTDRGDGGKIVAIKYIKAGHLSRIAYYLEGKDTAISECCLELIRKESEKKEEILDSTEKRYLYNIIRPFKDKVRYIKKMYCECSNKDYYHIYIKMEDTSDSFGLPFFEDDLMYKGMEVGKEYTLKELGL